MGPLLSQTAMRHLRFQEAVMNNQIKRRKEKPKPSFIMAACGCSKDCAFIRISGYLR